MVLSFRPEFMDLELGFKKKDFNGEWSKTYLGAGRFLTPWAMKPWHRSNFVILFWFLTYKNIMWSYLPNLTHDTSVNPRLPKYFRWECGRQGMLRTPGSIYMHACIYTSISDLSSVKLHFLSIFVSKNGPMWVKPKYQHVEDIFYYTQKYLNMLGNNIVYYTNLLWKIK